MNTDPIAALESLYNGLPEVACQGCGTCCVSPTCTLVEFLYIMQYSLNTLPESEIQRIISSSPRLHPAHDGNLQCPFLVANRCIVHKGRTGACRLFGVPALAEFGIKDMTECKHHIQILNGTSDFAFVKAWLTNLVALNRTFYAFEQEPYCIRGFNISCWLDLYFDETLDFDIFNELKHILHGAIDLSRWNAQGTPQTGLKEKVDKISLLQAILDSGDRGILQPLLLSIRDDYPLTGTYFYEEANMLLGELDKK